MPPAAAGNMDETMQLVRWQCPTWSRVRSSAFVWEFACARYAAVCTNFEANNRAPCWNTRRVGLMDRAATCNSRFDMILVSICTVCFGLQVTNIMKQVALSCNFSLAEALQPREDGRCLVQSGMSWHRFVLYILDLVTVCPYVRVMVLDET